MTNVESMGSEVSPVYGVYATGSAFSLAKPICDAPSNLAEQFAELHAELQRDECAHSWAASPWANAPSVPAILRAEHEARPTTLYFYCGARQELLGVGTVAQQLHRRRAPKSIPVIARAYVRARYRGRGVYRQMFRHRLGECLALDSYLDGVHIGTASPAVHRQLETSALTFVLLGHEVLHDAGSGVVGDYLWLHPRACLELSEAAQAMPNSPLRDTLCALAQGRCEEGDRALLARLCDHDKGSWPDGVAHRVLQFCAALELTETQ